MKKALIMFCFALFVGLLFGFGVVSACYDCGPSYSTYYSKSYDYNGGYTSNYVSSSPFQYTEKSKTVVKSQPYYYRGNYGYGYPSIRTFNSGYIGQGYGYPSYRSYGAYPSYRVNYGHGTYGCVPGGHGYSYGYGGCGAYGAYSNPSYDYWQRGYNTPQAVYGYTYKSYK
jgi:hypothetical protein